MTAANDPKSPHSGAVSDAGQAVEGGTAEERIERLTAELVEKTAEVERSRDLYLRERAELENYKKRSQRELGDALRYATIPLARDIAGVVDDLERAVEHAESGGNGQPLVEGVRLVVRNALDVLNKHGVTRIDAAGERFDPSRHEAIVSVPDAARPPNEVVQQFLPGYVLHDRVIRPAQVAVSVKPSVESASDDD
jgi:molecular chaperone GrpE